MLNWAFTFLVIALLAGLLGAFGVQFIAADIAWTLFVVFLVLFAISFFIGRRGPSVKL